MVTDSFGKVMMIGTYDKLQNLLSTARSVNGLQSQRFVNIVTVINLRK
jgi:hypothetical protein